MKRKKILGLLALLLAAAATLTLLTRRPQEPEYQGKRLSEWLREVGTWWIVSSRDTNAVFAVRQIGTNAIPWLLKEIDARDSWLKSNLIAVVRKQRIVRLPLKTDEWRQRIALTGFSVLGPEAAPAMPALVESLYRPDKAQTAADALILLTGTRWLDETHAPSNWTQERSNALQALRKDVVNAALDALTNRDEKVRSSGAAILAECTFNPFIAVPALIRMLKDPSEEVRLRAAAGLGQITDQPVAAIPPLIEALSDTNSLVRSSAARSLGNYHRQARTAVPYLLKARSDPDRFVRNAANRALDAIDPETAAAIPDLPDFKPSPP